MASARRSVVHDPGGKIRLALPEGTTGSAVFGGSRHQYRYRLIRTWKVDAPHVLFVMMNPSTADPLFDDPSVAKCGRYARAWGYGGLLVGNTFAYRATDKRRLTEVADPVGPENDAHLIAMAKSAALVVFAYGQPGHPTLVHRGPQVARLLVRQTGIVPHVLRLAINGTPFHPLYLRETLRPVPWPMGDL